MSEIKKVSMSKFERIDYIDGIIPDGVISILRDNAVITGFQDGFMDMIKYLDDNPDMLYSGGGKKPYVFDAAKTEFSYFKDIDNNPQAMADKFAGRGRIEASIPENQEVLNRLFLGYQESWDDGGRLALDAVTDPPYAVTRKSYELGIVFEKFASQEVMNRVYYLNGIYTLNNPNQKSVTEGERAVLDNTMPKYHDNNLEYLTSEQYEEEMQRRRKREIQDKWKVQAPSEKLEWATDEDFPKRRWESSIKTAGYEEAIELSRSYIQEEPPLDYLIGSIYSGPIQFDDLSSFTLNELTKILNQEDDLSTRYVQHGVDSYYSQLDPEDRRVFETLLWNAIKSALDSIFAEVEHQIKKDGEEKGKHLADYYMTEPARNWSIQERLDDLDNMEQGYSDVIEAMVDDDLYTINSLMHVNDFSELWISWTESVRDGFYNNIDKEALERMLLGTPELYNPVPERQEQYLGPEETDINEAKKHRKNIADKWNIQVNRNQNEGLNWATEEDFPKKRWESSVKKIADISDQEIKEFAKNVAPGAANYINGYIEGADVDINTVHGLTWVLSNWDDIESVVDDSIREGLYYNIKNLISETNPDWLSEIEQVLKNENDPNHLNVWEAIEEYVYTEEGEQFRKEYQNFESELLNTLDEQAAEDAYEAYKTVVEDVKNERNYPEDRPKLTIEDIKSYLGQDISMLDIGVLVDEWEPTAYDELEELNGKSDIYNQALRRYEEALDSNFKRFLTEEPDILYEVMSASTPDISAKPQHEDSELDYLTPQEYEAEMQRRRRRDIQDKWEPKGQWAEESDFKKNPWEFNSKWKISADDSVAEELENKARGYAQDFVHNNDVAEDIKNYDWYTLIETFNAWDKYTDEYIDDATEFFNRFMPEAELGTYYLDALQSFHDEVHNLINTVEDWMLENISSKSRNQGYLDGEKTAEYYNKNDHETLLAIRDGDVSEYDLMPESQPANYINTSSGYSTASNLYYEVREKYAEGFVEGFYNEVEFPEKITELDSSTIELINAQLSNYGYIMGLSEGLAYFKFLVRQTSVMDGSEAQEDNPRLKELMKDPRRITGQLNDNNINPFSDISARGGNIIDLYNNRVGRLDVDVDKIDKKILDNLKQSYANGWRQGAVDSMNIPANGFTNKQMDLAGIYGLAQIMQKNLDEITEVPSEASTMAQPTVPKERMDRLDPGSYDRELERHRKRDLQDKWKVQRPGYKRLDWATEEDFPKRRWESSNKWKMSAEEVDNLDVEESFLKPTLARSEEYFDSVREKIAQNPNMSLNELHIFYAENLGSFENEFLISQAKFVDAKAEEEETVDSPRIILLGELIENSFSKNEGTMSESRVPVSFKDKYRNPQAYIDYFEKVFTQAIYENARDRAQQYNSFITPNPFNKPDTIYPDDPFTGDRMSPDEYIDAVNNKRNTEIRNKWKVKNRKNDPNERLEWVTDEDFPKKLWESSVKFSENDDSEEHEEGKPHKFLKSINKHNDFFEGIFGLLRTIRDRYLSKNEYGIPKNRKYTLGSHGQRALAIGDEVATTTFDYSPPAEIQSDEENENDKNKKQKNVRPKVNPQPTYFDTLPSAIKNSNWKVSGHLDPIAYITNDGSYLCPTCAIEQYSEDPNHPQWPKTQSDDSPYPIAPWDEWYDVDPDAAAYQALVCEHCGRTIDEFENKNHVPPTPWNGWDEEDHNKNRRKNIQDKWEPEEWWKGSKWEKVGAEGKGDPSELAERFAAVLLGDHLRDFIYQQYYKARIRSSSHDAILATLAFLGYNEHNPRWFDEFDNFIHRHIDRFTQNNLCYRPDTDHSFNLKFKQKAYEIIMGKINSILGAYRIALKERLNESDIDISISPRDMSSEEYDEYANKKRQEEIKDKWEPESWYKGSKWKKISIGLWNPDNLEPSSYFGTKVVEEIPIDVAMQMLDIERGKEDYERENIDELVKHITENGFLEPIIIDFNVEDNTAYVSEGNHRVQAAKILGMEWIPARCLRNYTLKSRFKELPVKWLGTQTDHAGKLYIPPEFPPHMIGLPVKEKVKGFEDGHYYNGWDTKNLTEGQHNENRRKDIQNKWEPEDWWKGSKWMQKEAPARSKAQFRYMQGICNGSIEPPEGMTRAKACEYVKHQDDYKELPEKASKQKFSNDNYWSTPQTEVVMELINSSPLTFRGGPSVQLDKIVRRGGSVQDLANFVIDKFVIPYNEDLQWRWQETNDEEDVAWQKREHRKQWKQQARKQFPLSIPKQRQYVQEMEQMQYGLLGDPTPYKLEDYIIDVSKVDWNQIYDVIRSSLRMSNWKIAKPNLVPPEGVRAAARRGIEYHAQGKAGDGFEAATLTRAHKIANGEELTPEHVKRMHSFFERHAGGRSQKAKKGEITPWDVAWLAWGGNAGRSWAAAKVAELERSEKTSKNCKCWDGYKRVPGTKPCEPGSCEKCDAARKESKQNWRIAKEQVWEIVLHGTEGYDIIGTGSFEECRKKTEEWLKNFIGGYINYDTEDDAYPIPKDAKEQDKIALAELEKAEDTGRWSFYFDYDKPFDLIIQPFESKKESNWKFASEGLDFQEDENGLTVKDGDEVVGSVIAWPYEGGTFVEYIGYGSRLHPNRDADQIAELKSRYPKLGIDLLKWVRNNLEGPYYAAFANQELRRLLKAEPTGQSISIPESYAEELGEPNTEIPIEKVHRSNVL
jgi:ParB-like nuclease domain